MNTLYKLLVFFIILSIITPKGYYHIYPSLPIYPNNEKDVLLVKKEVASRTRDDIDFFNLTDSSISNAFKPYVEESIEELNNIITNTYVSFIILTNKLCINRARPYQLCKNINILNSKTGDTPAYPAGHAFQAYYLSKILTKKYPEKESIFKNIAERCDKVRVKAGIHYPSDGEYSKKLVNVFF